MTTVRQFIDKIKAHAQAAWEHLTPVFYEWGDGRQTACAVTAIGVERIKDGYEDYWTLAIDVLICEVLLNEPPNLPPPA